MSLDFVVSSCTRRCAASGRPLETNEPYYSVLIEEGNGVVRQDIAAEVWQGPPEDHLGWWRSKFAGRGGGKPKLAPGEVLLGLLDRWANEPEQLNARYILALLLIRRRVLRFEQASFADGLLGDNGESSDEASDEQAAAEEESRHELLRLYCPQNDKSYEVASVQPNSEQITAIQKHLSELLFSDAA